MVAMNDAALAPALLLGDEVAEAGANILTESSYGSDELSVVKGMLSATIIDGLIAILVLLRSHGQAHADTVGRSLFEAVGDLFHLCSVADGGQAYLDRLEMNSALQCCKVRPPKCSELWTSRCHALRDRGAREL